MALLCSGLWRIPRPSRRLPAESLSVTAHSLIHFNDGTEDRSVRWRSESGAAPPKRVVIADDTMTADSAFRFASEGVGLLWRSDFQNARQLLQALMRRVDRPRKPKRKQEKADAAPGAAFHRHRQAQAQRAHTLSMLLIPLEGDYGIPLRRAPDVRLTCSEAWGEADGEASVVSLRELLGLIGAHEWRKKGVDVPALGAHIHPHYGVFAPIRNEYVKLVAQATLPAQTLAFDIGTGTGVLAALLAKRGVARVVATGNGARARAGPATTSGGWGWRRRWRWWRPTSFRRVARRWSSATRRGYRRSPALRSSARSTIPAAGCCAVFSPGWRRISSRRVRAG